MIGHIVSAAIRALAASIVVGAILIYVVGGVDAPDAPSIVRVTVAGFFVFWLVFIFMFGKRVPKSQRGLQDDSEGGGLLWTRGYRRERHDSDRDSDTGHSGGGDSGGDGGGESC